MSIKIDRIASSMVKEISYLLATEVKNPNINFVTITDVKVTNDLSFAKVYFTVLDDSKRKETLEALNEASGFIRKKLCDRIDIRHMPELEFVFDESIAYGANIEKIIDGLNKQLFLYFIYDILNTYLAEKNTIVI